MRDSFVKVRLRNIAKSWTRIFCFISLSLLTLIVMRTDQNDDELMEITCDNEDEMQYPSVMRAPVLLINW